MFLPKLVHSQKFTVHGIKKSVNCQLSTVNCGFSLIELLVVIAIIGILVSFSSASWTNVQEKSRDGQRKTDLKALQQALETFYQQNGRYPFHVNVKISCTTTFGVGTEIPWGDPFTCGSNTFMQKLPLDPIFDSDSSRNFLYYVDTTSATTYMIQATLENANDPDRASDPCTSYNGNRNYCMTSP